jgi:hypothetical protein
MSHKDLCVISLVLSLVLWEDGVTSKKWGLVGVPQVIGGVPLKGIVESSPFLFF